MSSDKFWNLFAETGDIKYYLLYAQNAASDVEKKSEGEKPADECAIDIH